MDKALSVGIPIRDRNVQATEAIPWSQRMRLSSVINTSVV